ncbi:MAG: CHAT domain-containing protein [Myxococcota bacterium]
MQRVELWACESGVDVDTSGLGPTADEPYGMDGTFLLAGVRSTIGTLWPVYDALTGAVARRFRTRLAGMRADEALHRAKRWCRDEGADLIVRALRACDDHLGDEALSALVDAPAGAEPAPAAAAEPTSNAAGAERLRKLAWTRSCAAVASSVTGAPRAFRPSQPGFSGVSRPERRMTRSRRRQTRRESG